MKIITIAEQTLTLSKLDISGSSLKKEADCAMVYGAIRFLIYWLVIKLVLSHSFCKVFYGDYGSKRLFISTTSAWT